MSKHDDDDRDYEVGYRRPPKETRYQEGQSGNPNGRPKGAKGLKASLKRELRATITVNKGGQKRRISKSEALAKRVVERALMGDASATRMLMAVDDELSRDIEAQAATVRAAAELEPDDREILTHFAARARSGQWDPDGEE